MAKSKPEEPEVRFVVREPDALDKLLARVQPRMTDSEANTLRVALADEIDKLRKQALK